MNKWLVLSILVLGMPAHADPVSLSLPEGATLTFDAPEMTKVKEGSQGNVYQYVATSYGKGDPRFNLSIYVEPKACNRGSDVEAVTKCFVKMNSRNPAIVAESTKTRCSEKSCEVSYTTQNKIGERSIELAHTNTILVYGDLWVDVHFSITMPTSEDAAVSAKFSDSLTLAAN